MNRLCLNAAASGLLALSWMASAASAGTFANIVIDDLYDDWAGIPVLDSDPLDNAGGVDIADVQVANDSTYLYVRFTYHTPKSFTTYLSVDNDNNIATGYNIYGANLVGSEAAWANDFDFDQRAGFNIGTLKDPLGNPEPANGAALLSSFVDSNTREMAIRLDSTFDPFVGPGKVFPTGSFTLLAWADGGEVSSAIPYSLAVPEPSSCILGLASFAAIAKLRRRDRSQETRA